MREIIVKKTPHKNFIRNVEDSMFRIKNLEKDKADQVDLDEINTNVISATKRLGNAEGKLNNVNGRLAHAELELADANNRIENLEGVLLTYVEDSTTACEKDVPVGVGGNAVLSTIGGATKTSKNLLDPSLFGFTVNEDGSIRVSHDFGDEGYYTQFWRYITLPAGTYYIGAAFANLTDTVVHTECTIRYDGEMVVVVPWSLSNSFTLNAETEVEVELLIEGSSGLCEADYYLMLSTDPNAEFESFFEGRYGKVTAVESYGSNLLDPSLFGFPVNEDGSFTLTKDFGDWSMYEPSHSIYLEPNTYYFSYKVSNVTGNFTMNAFGLTHPEDYVCVDCLTITEAQTIMIFFSCEGTGEASADISVMLTTEPDAEFEPYSTEPIDVFVIPEEIRALDGYGRDGFTLDFVTKTATYGDEVTDVSSYLSHYDEFNILSVQPGGILRFVNEHELGVPSSVIYVKKKA